MARVTIEVSEINCVRDLSRFLLLLDLIGIDPEGNHPVRRTLDGLAASIGSNDLLLPGDDTEEAD